MAYHRPIFQTIVARLQEPRVRMQVLAGPRQCGKTTLARQVLSVWSNPSRYASADEVGGRDRLWIETMWNELRRELRETGPGTEGLLVLDEIQKIPAWSDTIKSLWDDDTWHARPIKVLLLGSSPLLVQRGLSESLAGRFEKISVPHWSFTEMRDAFGWTLDQFIFFGGYPGGADLIRDPDRWSRYVLDALVETTFSRDIFQVSRVDKPHLLRRLLELACVYSGRILSYQKMVGQLQDAGNTTTLAHYLDLLSGAGLVTGLQKYSGELVRARASSPKLVALNNALVSAISGRSFRDANSDASFRGRLVESAVGAHVARWKDLGPYHIHYWRERNEEVDFVVRRGSDLLAIEVKSSERRESLPGMVAFRRAYPAAGAIVVGGGGIELEDFFLREPEAWFD